MSSSKHASAHKFDRIDRAERAIRKIIDAVARKAYAEAAIRASQAGISSLLPDLTVIDSLCKKFNPAEPRDSRGRWTEVGGEQAPHHPQPEAIVDPFCRMIKKVCIAEATDALPTRDFGASFFKAVNACVDRYGCLGRA